MQILSWRSWMWYLKHEKECFIRIYKRRKDSWRHKTRLSFLTTLEVLQRSPSPDTVSIVFNSLQKILLGYIFKWTKSRQVVVQLAPSWTEVAWATWPVLTWCLCWSVAETGLCAIAHVQLPRPGTRKWRIWEDSKNINRILEILNLGRALVAA